MCVCGGGDYSSCTSHLCLLPFPLAPSLLYLMQTTRTLQGNMSATGPRSTAVLHLVREISMLDVGRPLQDMALVPVITLMTGAAAQQGQDGTATANGSSTHGSSLPGELEGGQGWAGQGA